MTSLLHGRCLFPWTNWAGILPIAQRAIGIIGSYVGNLQELKEVVALAKKGKLKPLPLTTRPGAEASAALEDLKAGRVVGRVVLDFEMVDA